MMPDHLLGKIKSVSHLRVVIRPTEAPLSISTAKAYEAVEHASVSLRGWDYPHVPRQEDRYGGVQILEKYAQGWCDWSDHSEFWRMYKSGQFLHYKAQREDFRQKQFEHESAVLAVGSFIYTLTEITEFAHRLGAARFYKHGANIHVELRNCLGRRLWVEDPMHFDFLNPMVTNSESISVERTVSASELVSTDPKRISLQMLMEFFHYFGWKPSAGVIEETQSQLYRLNIGRDR